MEHESDSDTSCNLRTRCSYRKISTGTGRLDNKRTSGYHPNTSIVEIGHNTVKGPGDSRRLAITQIPVENHQVMLV